jgi:hypothetical protein
MKKIYLVLSKNKESGPYTLEELRGLPLTSADLVWVEGQSAGWHYPSELPELKDLAATPVTAEAKVASLPRSTTSPETAKPKQAEAKKVFVSLPSGFQRQEAEVRPSLEEKAEAIRQKALNFAAQKEPARQSQEEDEVRYTRTIADIKQEYSGWLHEQKKPKRRVGAMPLIYTGIFVAIIAAVFFIVRRQPVQSGAETPVIASKSTQITPNNNEATTKNNEVATPENTVFQPQQETGKPLEEISFPAEKSVTPQKQVPELKPPVVKENITKPAVQKTQEAKEPVTEPPLKKVQTTISEASVKEKKPVVTEPEVPVADLIETTSNYVQTDEGIALSISFRNKSAQVIKVAAVDVFYFDKDNMKVGKQTLYFSNVAAGTTITRTSVPQKAASASYRLGLVSAERSGLYVQHK